jgi:hypothetical protein
MVMGQGRPGHGRCSRATQGESAVTPVIGAILILAITIMGIAGVLYWGAPMIERIQAQNAQVAVVGEFQDLRDASSVLSVPDHSRFPTIVIPRGDLDLQKGSRIMVTADRDGTANPTCDFRVTEWADTTAPTQVTVSASGCRTPVSSTSPASGEATLQVYQVSGATLVLQTVTGCCATPTVAGADFSAGDWLFRLANSACPSGICAEAWIHSSDQVAWALASGAGERGVVFDNGAIFSNSDGSIFLEREPTVGDSVFGAGYYGFWLRSLTANSYNGLSGAGSHQVYLSLLGNYDRVDSSTVTRLRFDVFGDLSESWCNSFLSRSDDLPDGGDAGTEPDAIYTGAGPVASPCAAIDTAGARSVCFSQVTTNACTSAGAPFTFRFLHARIYTSLAA